MIARSGISPLRIANEAFLIASTIERCPRQMMLRELVMNALEAAAQATDAPKSVKIDAVPVDGTPKLRIWNTGRGLTAAELLQISDLSSSLFKTVALDGNFGMGAKAASLASNKRGLRYRSCRLGQVSQILLGARDGVYGRLLQGDPASGELAEVLDITAAAAAAGEDLSHDWTDVTLFGNSAEQNTAADPYAGDPSLPRDWIVQTLGRRFMRFPAGVELVIEPSASGGQAAEIFAPAAIWSQFDRIEAVDAGDGVTIHYAFRVKDSTLPPQRVNSLGLGAVVYDGEVYALTDERRWALEAPTYGFTFAARQCTVLVELPHGYPVRPEQYRQFLRFTGGDQHQAHFADFGELVQRRRPEWLKRLISSMLPAESDHLAEIRNEMRDLLVELGLEDLLRAAPPGEPQAPAPVSERPPEERGPPRPSPRRPPPDPPEIIRIEDEAEIIEKSLGGRAARYYPAARQVFVNTRYSAFARMQAQLAEEFAAYSDADTVQRLAKVTAEWAIIQRIARSLLYGIGKPKSGWSAEEVSAVQTPETMSLMVDDISTLLGAARQRMAARLGLEPDASQPVAVAPASTVQRAALELADAEAHLQRAMTADAPNLGQFYRQIASIHARQRNPATARAWLEKGMEVDPADAWCRFDYAGLLLADQKFDLAAQFVDQARAMAADNLTPIGRRQAEIATCRGHLAEAEAMLNATAAADPHSPWPHYDLAGLQLQQGRIDAAAAAARAALERGPEDAKLLQRLAEIELRRGDHEASLRLSKRAIALDPRDPWVRITSAKAHAAEGRFDEAQRELDAGFDAEPVLEAPLHRAQSEIELQSGRRAAALASAQRAVRADPADAWSHYHLSVVLQLIGDLDRAAAAAAEALRLAPAPSAPFLRRQADIEGVRGDPKKALELLERALALAPNDPYTLVSVSTQHLALNDLAEADDAAQRAEAKLTNAERSTILRRRAQIAQKREDGESAKALLSEAMRLAPQNPWLRFDTANQLFAEGDLDAASALANEAIALSPAPHADMLIRAATFEQHRQNWDAARAYLEQAAAANSADPRTWALLADVLFAAGDLLGAQEAAEKAAQIASAGASPKRASALAPAAADA
jgi:tetratricopeptide (TPR) repeat protein